ncbi:MAG: carbohydrate ABC transporter permease [Chloroflexi bacterium]|nr:carbohydrate ABC transporter permease [Chloroflexota bacterium]MBI3740663.1 carbohydrate ABC transporter permease [Chloroflexota bacterium]
MNRDRARSLLVNGAIHTVLIAGALFMLFPFVWMVFGSLKSYNEATTAGFFPRNWLISNYPEAIMVMNGSKPCAYDAGNPFAILDQCLILRYFANTISIGLVTVLGVLTTGVLAAYAFARLKFPGRDFLFIILLATLMIPGELTLVPNYVFMVRFPTPDSLIATMLNLDPNAQIRNWVDTYYALTIPWIATVFSIFLFRQFFRSIPNELYDAAVMDGATHSRFLWSVVLPLSKPALITSAVLTFLGTWNSLIWPLLVTNSAQMRPIQVGLAAFITEAGTQVQLLMAGATMTIIPIMVLYLVLQKWFVEGIASVGIRG